MKREILHEKCVQFPRGVGMHDDPLDVALSMHEETRCIRGTARRGIICDHCGNPIPKGTPAAAMSYIGIGQTGFEWEGDYLEVDERRAGDE